MLQERLRAALGDENGVMAPTDTRTDVLVGDLIEAGVGNAADSFRTSRETLGQAATFRRTVTGTASNFAPTAWKNRRKLGLSALPTAIKYFVARSTDQLIAKDLEVIAELSGRLTKNLEEYDLQVQHDRQAHNVQQHLIRDLAGISELIRNPARGYRFNAWPTGNRGKVDSAIRLELHFSAPLLAAPRAELGSVTVPLQRSDQIGRRWAGSIPPRSLPAGVHLLTVTVGPQQSPHGGLDSNPQTPAVRRGTALDWTGFEKGADTNHRIPLGEAPPEPEPPLNLTGTWIGQGYQCEGGDPPERVEITQTGNRVLARKITGDRCVPAGQPTFRGTIDGEIECVNGTPDNPASGTYSSRISNLTRRSFSACSVQFTRE